MSQIITGKIIVGLLLLCLSHIGIADQFDGIPLETKVQKWMREMASNPLLASNEGIPISDSEGSHNKNTENTPIQKDALVIGNSDYISESTTDLHNPIYDAAEISAQLQKLGFNVTLLLDADQQQMENAIEEFTMQENPERLSFFYYAGHGVQVKKYGNYLIPVDANIKKELDVRRDGVSVAWVLESMEYANNKTNIIVLDACRNNPFGYQRSQSQGLMAMNAPKGSIIAYATSPGEVALDGTGNNGIYTKNLLRHLREPLEIKVQLTRVAADVQNETLTQYGQLQVPWFSSSLTDNLYLSGSQDNPYVATIEKDKPRMNINAQDKTLVLLPVYLQNQLGININFTDSNSILKKWWFWAGATAVTAVAINAGGGEGGKGGAAGQDGADGGSGGF